MKTVEKALKEAMQHNKKDTFITLLNTATPEDINAGDTYGRTVLHTVAFHADVKYAEILLGSPKTDICKQDNSGDTPLHIASRYGYTDIVRLLLDNKARVDITNAELFTPLHQAVDGSHTKAAEMLMAHKADINIMSLSGTALHIAAINKGMEMIALLVSKGGDLSAKRHDGQTAKDIFDLCYPDCTTEFDQAIEEGLKQLKNEATEAYPNHEQGKTITINGKKRKSYNDQDDTDNSEYADSYKINNDKHKGDEDGYESSLASGSSDAPHGGNGVSSRSQLDAQPSDQQHSTEESSRSQSNLKQSANYEDKRSYVQVTSDNTDSTTAENLLKTIFTWIKDLPDNLQKQVLSSFSMQQVLQVLEIIKPDKFINDQLSNQPLEERFASDYQKYYGSDNITSISQEYAEVNQDSISAFMNDEFNVVSSDGVLIDPLPKHDIGFSVPHLFGGITS